MFTAEGCYRLAGSTPTECEVVCCVSQWPGAPVITSDAVEMTLAKTWTNVVL